jgi:hypothetical protein
VRLSVWLRVIAAVRTLLGPRRVGKTVVTPNTRHATKTLALNSPRGTNSYGKLLPLAGRGRDWLQSRGGAPFKSAIVVVGDTVTIDPECPQPFSILHNRAAPLSLRYRAVRARYPTIPPKGDRRLGAVVVYRK